MVRPAGSRAGSARLARQTALVVSVVLSFAAGLFIFWKATDAILVMMVGIVASVVFDAGARGIALLVSWPRRIRLVIVFIMVALLAALLFWWGGTTISGEAQQFIASMATLPRKLRDFLSKDLSFLPANPEQIMKFLPDVGTLFGDATTIITTIADSIVKAVAVVFIGAFFSWEPGIYKAVVLSILPRHRRARVDAVLNESAHAMRQWMLGQSISMAIIFMFSLVALEAVGMPYPFLLALQAGLLTFVPTLGPFAGGIVIILAGFSISPRMALYGLGTYALIQFLESNLVTPLVQRRTVRIPPAIALGLQLIAWLLFGLLGVAFILPIAAAAKVFIEELYVKDQLESP